MDHTFRKVSHGAVRILGGQSTYVTGHIYLYVVDLWISQIHQQYHQPYLVCIAV
jgi:hypothetical protein